jgi:hypothetical protein
MRLSTKYLTAVIAVFLLQVSNAFSQCNPGEVEIEVFVETDAYGYEGYWSLVYGNSACGVNEIAKGGNNAVGCNGGGAQNQTPGGYGNHLTFSAGKWCVKKDTTLTLHYIDDWGDGGFGFSVTVNGYIALANDAHGAGAVWTFSASEPPAIDVNLDELVTPYSYAASGNNNVTGYFRNEGKDTVNSLDVSYSINGAVPVTANLTGLSVAYGERYAFTHPNPFNIANGNHNIEVWTSNVNGQVDSLNSNDTLSVAFEVGPGIPNIIDQYIGITPNKKLIVNSSNQVNKPTDLDFHPVLTRKELWIVNKRTEQIGGSTVTVSNAGEANQSAVHKVDGNAWHFMSLPTGIAFSENENFATSPGVFDANHNGGTPFTGPTLWSSDPSIYAQPSGGNGSHLDMLHNSPKSQGIAHEYDNVFWVFDGESDDLVRYDFKEDHGPGASYHGDAIVRRYRDHFVKKDPNEKVVSHLVLDKTTNWLYVVNHGDKKVHRLDITSGSVSGNSNIHNYEPVEEYTEVTGYTWETVVSTGLQQPAGIDVIGDRMIVSDYATGEIVIYDISVIPAVEKGRIQTGAQGIMGVKIGPDGKIWYVDFDANKVFRLDLSSIGINEWTVGSFEIYPNPSNGEFNIRFAEEKEVEVTIIDVLGQLLYQDVYESNQIRLDLELKPGTYFTTLKNIETGAVSTQKIIVQ